MWKPAEVLPEHKRRAVVLWLGLILAILGYSVYLIYEAVQKSKNPSTSFVLSDDLYKYPDVYVCLYDFFGCDSLGLEEDCMSSANSTEGGLTTATFNPGQDNEQRIVTEAKLTDERGWCVVFHSSDVEIYGGERDPEDYILLNMYWYPGGRAKASTTCISEEGEWESHSESMFMFLRDPDSLSLSAGIQVAYTCMTNASSSHVFNYVGIGLTREVKIKNEDNTATYKALTTSSAVYKDKRDGNITGISSPYAWLSMEIAQQTDSLETITEIDPLEVAEMFGTVGGFWDLLLILWPVFFVATSQQDPHLKVRNFRKSIQTGAARAKVLSAMVGRSKPMQQGGKTVVEEDEEKPAWDSANPTFRQQRALHGEPSQSHGVLPPSSPPSLFDPPRGTRRVIPLPVPERRIFRTQRGEWGRPQPPANHR